MRKYIVTTQWRDPRERIVFNRVHIRVASSINDAVAQERAHNATRKSALAEDGFTQCRIIRCVAKGVTDGSPSA